MRASRGITDVASTINSVWFQSNLTHRGQIIGTRPFNLPSHRTHYTSIMAAAMHHLHLDTLLSLLSHTGGQAHWATTEVCLSSVCGNESDPPMGRGEMRPCIQYTGEMRLKSASFGRISPVRHGRFHTVGTATQALLWLVVGVGGRCCWHLFDVE